MLMPVPVMVMELSGLEPFVYIQVTPLCFKVAEVVLAVTILFDVSPPVTESHFLSVSVPPFNFPSAMSA